MRVLIVDDSEDDSLLLADELRENGYDPISLRVETPVAMTNALREQTWDIVIADYTMPHFSGPAALGVLRDSGLDIPLILVSGTAEDHAGVDMMRAGAQDFILKHNLSRLGPAVSRELREAESRRQRRLAEERERDLEAHKREFYSRTIVAATEGKLVISEPDDIRRMAGPPIRSWAIGSLKDISDARNEIRQLAAEHGMDSQRVTNLLGCAVEAMANVHKHAGDGLVTLHTVRDGLMLVARDDGPGIEALALPDVALTKGYTTAISLGMGYKVMIELADKVYLATSPEGTIVAIEMALRAEPSPMDAALSKLQGW
ncbi:MAG: response regulator [Armatimonadetes bacterium]|nr:response regulator [Armatimonadota bacterium]